MFEPNAGDAIAIGNDRWVFVEHPVAPGMPYGEMGRAATVYQLLHPKGHRAALKVFKPAFRHESLVKQADGLNQYAGLPGLRACHRVILSPRWHEGLLQQHPDLRFAALMTWIEGRPWSTFIRERLPLTQSQSQGLAYALLRVLVEMGQQGVAHGDLSGSNLLIDDLESGAPQVELVDVEQLYGSKLTRPHNVPAGSPGYTHLEIHDRPWQSSVDRFAGAILLAEILGWCDERVRAAADSEEGPDGEINNGESYFAEGELQQDCERYRLLHDVLIERWGDGAAALLAQAWGSKTLAECPPFTAGQWSPPPPPPSPPLLPPVNKARDDLVAAAVAAEQAGEWARASNYYQKLITGWPDDPDRAQWAAARDQALAGIPSPRRWWPAITLVLVLFVCGGLMMLAASMIDISVGGGPATETQITVPAEITLPPTERPAPTARASQPVFVDSDGDGLSDDQETQNYNTDPNNPDSDGDGLSDAQEVQNYNTDPNNPDSDGDGLSDAQEVQNYNTDPNNPDSDGDGLSDGQEAQNYSTDPNNPDSDGDGMSDAQEVQNHNTDPNNPDRPGSPGNEKPQGADSPPPEKKSPVSRLRLMNPATGRTVIDRIETGDTISLRDSGCGSSGACNLNVEAIVDDSNVASVVFRLDGRPFDKNGRTLENTAPYYMAGDTNLGPQSNWDWSALAQGSGKHTIEAVPCDQPGGQGNCGPPLSVTFTVTR